MSATRITVVAAAIALGLQAVSGVAADSNKMGYRLETAEQASGLARSGGSLGMRVGAEKQISSEGLTFELLKVEAVGARSPAAQAGLSAGDQIIAVDGRVFPDTSVFAGYVGSVRPGQQIEIDYMPAGGGPKQAQRVGVTVGEGGRAAPPQQKAPGRTTLSTGDKIAIGAGAAAIFGCYEYNCISKLKNAYQKEREKLRNANQAQPQPTH